MGIYSKYPLLLGSIVASFVSLPKSVIATIMAFGSGVLVAALGPSLVEEAFRMSQSVPPVIIGFGLGGLSHTIANYILDKRSKGQVWRRKRSHGDNSEGGKEASGLSLLVGFVMDNIPKYGLWNISCNWGWCCEYCHDCCDFYF